MTLIQLRKKVRQSLVRADEKLLIRLLKVVEEKKYKRARRSPKQTTKPTVSKKTNANAYRREELKIQRGLNKRSLKHGAEPTMIIANSVKWKISPLLKAMDKGRKTKLVSAKRIKKTLE